MVLSHLVHFEFIDGATASEVVADPTFSGFYPLGPYAHLDGFTSSEAVVVSDGLPETSGGGGGVAKWPGRTEHGWEKWWRKEDERLKRLKKKKKAAEKKVGELEESLRDARQSLRDVRSLERIQALLRQLERIQAALDRQQAIVDELEMREVALVWALWNQ